MGRGKSNKTRKCNRSELPWIESSWHYYHIFLEKGVKSCGTEQEISQHIECEISFFTQNQSLIFITNRASTSIHFVNHLFTQFVKLAVIYHQFKSIIYCKWTIKTQHLTQLSINNDLNIKWFRLDVLVFDFVFVFV